MPVFSPGVSMLLVSAVLCLFGSFAHCFICSWMHLYPLYPSIPSVTYIYTEKWQVKQPYRGSASFTLRIGLHWPHDQHAVEVKLIGFESLRYLAAQPEKAHFKITPGWTALDVFLFVFFSAYWACHFLCRSCLGVMNGVVIDRLSRFWIVSYGLLLRLESRCGHKKNVSKQVVPLAVVVWRGTRASQR